jgi:hypothetical protein
MLTTKAIEKTKYWECGRKRGFDTVKQAKGLKRGMLLHRKLEAIGMMVYECRWCGKFHLGHPTGYGKLVENVGK